MTRLCLVGAEQSVCLSRTRKGEQAFFRLEAFYELGTRLFLAEPLRWAIPMIIGAQVPGLVWHLAAVRLVSLGCWKLFEIVVLVAAIASCV